MYMHVQSSDIIRLIQQFLKEQSLDKTLESLQEESGVEFNSINDVDELNKNINNGNWSAVLETIRSVKLPNNKLMNLYEQIIVEIAERGDIETSLSILRQSPSLSKLKKDFVSRIQRLQQSLSKYPFDPSNFYSTEEEKQLCRKNIADDICDEVYSVESSRLLTLLNQSLKWQQSIGVLPKGSKLDLLRNSSLSERTQREKVITKLDNEIKFGDGDTHAESAVFSPDGQLLATGTTDGFIEIWDFDTAKLNTDLKYQAADELMIHSDAVLCLCFSTDSEKLAVGTKDGQIKIFRVSDGECIHYFKEAHGAGVTSVKFSGDGSQVLSSSLDFTAKIHGVRSGKTLKVFRGHKSFVNDVHFANSNSILTASSDGTMKLWSIKDSSCVHTINSGDKESAIVSICPFPRKNDLFFVCSRSPSVHLIRSNGSVLKSYAAPPRNGVEACFVAIATSSLGKYLYCVDEKNILYCFLVETGKLLHAVKTHEKGVLGIRHHPHLNILASFSLDHSLRLWRPKK